MPLLHGAGRSIFAGSRVTLQTKDAHADREATVLYFDPIQVRWACEVNGSVEPLIVLVRCNEFRFDHYVAPTVELKAPPHLRVEAVDGCGNALFTQQPCSPGDVLLVEPPFMVANCSCQGQQARPILAIGTYGWAAYRHAQQQQEHEQQANGAAGALAAFDALGGGADVLSPDFSTRSVAAAVVEAYARALPTEERERLLGSSELLDEQRAEVAHVLASWLSNAHDLTFDGGLFGVREETVVLYHLGSKLLHSCEPNCVRDVNLDTGEISIIAWRYLDAGELLTLDYTGGSVSALRAPDMRRLALRSMRGFECGCARCERETAMVQALERCRTSLPESLADAPLVAAARCCITTIASELTMRRGCWPRMGNVPECPVPMPVPSRSPSASPAV
jgi:hypothetical protein